MIHNCKGNNITLRDSIFIEGDMLFVIQCHSLQIDSFISSKETDYNHVYLVYTHEYLL